ncbi:MAG: hypothetical protein KBG73_14320, partial [Candidatus Promineofilum sp.]|nr:hypothetical protein [Promineifilum sp.]
MNPGLITKTLVADCLAPPRKDEGGRTKDEIATAVILHPSSLILEEGRDNAASTTFFKTRGLGRIVSPLRVVALRMVAFKPQRRTTT